MQLSTLWAIIWKGIKEPCRATLSRATEEVSLVLLSNLCAIGLTPQVWSQFDFRMTPRVTAQRHNWLFGKAQV